MKKLLGAASLVVLAANAALATDWDGLAAEYVELAKEKMLYELGNDPDVPSGEDLISCEYVTVRGFDCRNEGVSPSTACWIKCETTSMMCDIKYNHDKEIITGICNDEVCCRMKN
jgi:hypothetical protein